MGDHNPLLLLLVQFAIIVALSRFMGHLFSRLRQPQVIGEMVAGIMLGPSLFGLLYPAAHGWLFPKPSVELLNAISQFGVIFFLFLVGLDLDPKLLRSRGRSAVFISISSIVLPFGLGAALTVFMFNWGGTFDPTVHRMLPSAIFMGAAMSITAFPVLARILTERRLHKTEVGAVTIACAAVDDLASWVMLALAVGVAHASGPGTALRTVAYSAAYVAGMFLLVRPFLGRLQLLYERQGRLSQGVVAVIFLLVLGSAALTDAIGIHAMFGAFLMGFIMPKGTEFVRHLGEKLEDFIVVLLLPIFFACAGLRTQIGLLSDTSLWGQAAIVITVACVGKFGGTTFAARALGIGWREASAMGVLMNTRGLMELVILTVGLQLGVINDTVFTIMVLMALFTTFITTPLLHWIYPSRLLSPVAEDPGAASRGEYRVLIPVSHPGSGGPLVRLADLLTGPEAGARVIYALHLARPVAREAYSRTAMSVPTADADATLKPLLDDARTRGIPVEPISFVSRDVAADIGRVVRAKAVNLVLMGFHRPVFSRAILGGTVHRVMTGVEADVAVFVDRGFTRAQCVLVPHLGGRHDWLALVVAARLAKHAGAKVTVLHVVVPGLKAVGAGEGAGAKETLTRALDDPSQSQSADVRVVEDTSPADAVLRVAADFDLVIIGVSEEWGLESHLFGMRPERIAERCPTSLLIVRAHEAVPLSQREGARGVDVETPAQAL